MIVLPDLKYYIDLVPCRKACPVKTNSGAYVRAIAKGNDIEGYINAASPNPFASVCGRICAHPCELLCRRGKIDEAISIRALKRFLTERYGPENPLMRDKVMLSKIAELPGKDKRSKMKVAVIGAGPSGLSCAYFLSFLGYKVTIFESAPVAGGMLYLGIPEYRLPRDIIRAEIDRILDMGVEIKYNFKLGKDFSINDLLNNDYLSVYIAIGATKGKALDIPGADLPNVLNGIEFLINANLGYKFDLKHRVLIVGGGNVAIDVARMALRYEIMGWEDGSTLVDAARTALRLGARKVEIICLESREEMPAYSYEVEEAEKEGIEIYPSRGPNKIQAKDGGSVILETKRCTRVFDENGRFNPTFDESVREEFQADTIILAIGQTLDTESLKFDPEIELTQRNTIKIDPRTFMTTKKGVFAGGDAVFGPRIVIDAVADGKKAALRMHEYLSGEEVLRAKPAVFISVPHLRWKENYDRIKRQEVPMLPVEKRTGFKEVELGYEEFQARTEGRRCLWCNLHTIFDSSKCILCGGCVDICPEKCLKIIAADKIKEDFINVIKVEFEIGDNCGVIIKDEDLCIRCGLCAERCPVNAITMEVLKWEETQENELAYFKLGMEMVQ